MKITDEQMKCLLGLAKTGFAAQPAIKAYNDFEKSMTQLQEQTGQSSEQLAELSEAILHIADDVKE